MNKFKKTYFILASIIILIILSISTIVLNKNNTNYLQDIEKIDINKYDIDLSSAKTITKKANSNSSTSYTNKLLRNGSSLWIVATDEDGVILQNIDQDARTELGINYTDIETIYLIGDIKAIWIGALDEFTNLKNVYLDPQMKNGKLRFIYPDAFPHQNKIENFGFLAENGELSYEENNINLMVKQIGKEAFKNAFTSDCNFHGTKFIVRRWRN